MEAMVHAEMLLKSKFSHFVTLLVASHDKVMTRHPAAVLFARILHE